MRRLHVLIVLLVIVVVGLVVVSVLATGSASFDAESAARATLGG